MEKENPTPEYSDLWDINDEQTPFHSWGLSDYAVVVLEYHVRDYIPKEITGQYGPAHYLQIEVDGSLQLFKISSKRLRKALLGVCEKAKKFPITVRVTRSGTGFNTDYKAQIEKVQKTLD